MFTIQRHGNEALEKAIDEAIRYLDPNSEDYLQTIEGIERLNKLKATRRVSPDTLAIVAGNLLGILMILHHESVNVITSKAIGFVLRIK